MRDTPYLLQIGRLIKETRLKNGTRIREIAEKAKVSKGLISKIENARTVPSLPVLISVITALDINIGDFFQNIKPLVSPDFIHSKKQDLIVLEKEKSKGFEYHHILNQDFQSFSFDSVLLEISQNAKRDFVTTDGYEFLYILDGCVDYNLGDKQIKLEKGDSLFFNGRTPHLPKNSGNSLARILVIYILN